MNLFRGKFKGWIFKTVASIMIFLLCLLVLPNNAKSEEIDALKLKVDALTDQREAVEKDISGFDAQLKILEDKIKTIETENIEREKKITESKKELEIQKKYLSEYLRVIYEDGQTSFFEQIIKAATFSDFVNRNEYLNTVRDRFKSSVDNVEKLKSELEADQKKMELNKKILQITREAYEKQKIEKETELSKLKAEEMRIRERFADRLTKAGGSPYCRNEGKIIKAKYSVFNFPINCGYISQGFGNTEFASIDKAYRGAIHNGVDVGIGPGTEIKSIGKGVVYAKGSSPSGGWGNWVMVKHDKVKIGGNDIEFYSLYGHMISETFLDIGSRVDQSTIVGWVGGTPYWAPHLHFSLFISNSGWGTPNPNSIGAYPGNVIDPLDYMDIPISTSGTDWDLNYAH